MRRSETEPSSFSSSLAALSPLFSAASPPPPRPTSPLRYLPVSASISRSLLPSPSISRSLSDSLIARHLCDKWSSFFSGNSPLMDFSPLFFSFKTRALSVLRLFSFPPHFSSLAIRRRTSHLLRRINALKANWCFHAFRPTTFGHFVCSF